MSDSFVRTYLAGDFVMSAGSVLFRREADTGKLQVCLIYQPERNEWLLPKGRKDRGESIEAAAVRETYEECGVLLAGPGHGSVDPQARDDLVARRRTLGDVLRSSGRPLRADLLVPWVRWVTPEAEPRRYDTAFFVAAVPDGQEADARTTEAVRVERLGLPEPPTGTGVQLQKVSWLSGASILLRRKSALDLRTSESRAPN